MAGLVRFGADLGLGQGDGEVVGQGREKVMPGLVCAGRAFECFAVHGDRLVCGLYGPVAVRGVLGGGAVAVGEVGAHGGVQGVWVYAAQDAVDGASGRGTPSAQRVGAHADLVAWPRGDRPPLAGSAQMKDYRGGKVVSRAGQIRAGDPLQTDRLRAALRWFADDLWAEEPTAR
ncbi:hypothetical protein [Nocardiopsis aegyptia]|uniref:Phage-related minor tail protein n=1 Tax=Nocardiopsis aegyptia TaxID=220378 RepID=A0A7Z0J8D8_9ACTN|nr:hypothetical protein [Nocardiopsis aegyptia]NYJ32866.1 phage-related minor tail protein [Nocardiopsis aegyptia]